MKSSKTLRDVIVPHAKRTRIGRGQTLLLQGDISDTAYLVESGCLRLCHNDDGRDITVQFFRSGDLVASLESFMKRLPSLFGIESIHPTVVYAVHKSRIDALMAQSGDMQALLFEGVVGRFAEYQGLFLSRITDNPEKRYKQLLSRDPNLFETVPQHFIASYLGITPVSLSRIRKKIRTVNNR